MLRGSKPDEAKIASNILNRNFTSEVPNAKWVTDITEFKLFGEKLYLSPVLSRKGNCYDNSVMENFFGIMKSEFLYLKEFESLEHFKKELKKNIEYYNTKRMKAKFKMSPVEYRTHFNQAA